MRAARWSSVLFLVSVSVLAGIHFLTAGPTGGEDPANPDRGSLAPLMTPPPRRVAIARVDPEFGRVMDLAVRGEVLGILAAEGWIIQAGGSRVTWKGDRTPGAPNWVGKPVSMALGPEAVFVLDGERSLVARWDTAGIRLQDLPLPFGSTYAQRPTQLLVSPGGRPVVTVQRVEMDGSAFWDILRYDTAGVPEAVLSVPSLARSMVFREPFLAVGEQAVFSMGPLTHELTRLELAPPRILEVSARTDPPLWYVPRRHRREYRRILAGLGAEATRLSELPEFWPSVRDFTVRDDGSFLITITAGEDRQHIERLSAALEPIGRFNRDGFLEPLFLSQGRAFVIEEAMDGTVIYELITESD